MSVQAMVDKFTNQFINGEWKQGSGNSTIVNRNPYSGDLLLTIPSANKADLDEAYKAAKVAQVAWADMPIGEKQGLFDRLTQVVVENKDQIVDWLVKESGSTLLKANVEFGLVLNIIRESATFMTRITGNILPSAVPGKENRIYRLPKGVIGVIGPWNFPFILSMRSVAPALATGNSVVIKPASDTPVTSGLLIAHLFKEAGFPDGLVNVVVGKGSEIGDEFVTHPIPKLISFTGSTEVGRRIGELAGKNLKEVALELGGNNVMVVLNDADIKQAAKAAAFGKFLHQGQICMALNRIIVDEAVHDEFVEEFVAIAKTLQAGDPTDPATFVGPLINEEQVTRIRKDIDASIQQGAKVLLEGRIENSLIAPTVLVDVKNDMPIAQNEIFGPVAAIIKVQNEEEAIQVANDSEYGLSGSIFTQDLHRGAEVAKRIETGMIHVNDQSVNDESHVPFGGEKGSGIGRFNGEWVIEKFTTTKWISIQHQYRDFPL